MRNKIRDSLVTAFTEELQRSGLSQRNAFYVANEKYLALKKLYWLPNQQNVARPGTPPCVGPEQCRKSAPTYKKRRRGGGKQALPLCPGVQSDTDSGSMSRLEHLETCLEVATLVFSVLRCLSGLGRARGAADTSPHNAVGQGHESRVGYLCRRGRQRHAPRHGQRSANDSRRSVDDEASAEACVQSGGAAEIPQPTGGQ
jgi:hypothetical protein